MNHVLEVSVITTIIILISMTYPTWYTFLTFYNSGSTLRKSVGLSLLCLVWGIVMFVIVCYRWVDNLSVARPMAGTIAILIFIFIPVILSLVF